MKKLIIGMSLLVAILFTAIGCSNEKVASSDASKSIDVVGSTSVTPVATKLAEAFSKQKNNVKIDVQGVGSTHGVKAANDGIANIGMASRNLKSGEKEWGLTQHIIAYDGIVITVHPSNEVSDIDVETAQKIFSGEIKNWKEIGGKDEDILVISREAGSGTRGAFESIIKLYKKNSDGKKISTVVKDALIADSTGAVMANISKKENSIGYISLSYLNDSVKGLKLDGIVASIQSIKDSKYKLARPFLFVTKGEINDTTKEFIDYVLSDAGQKIISEKLIPVK
ncbi:phosphate ABC transporter substrate-binding protein [Clostridiaceae bacterium M8S5]|nr:phosphate ABC transporter substrate-binding protein [Clostridiaceae bacterium M8S5]